MHDKNFDPNDYPLLHPLSGAINGMLGGDMKISSAYASGLVIGAVLGGAHPELAESLRNELGYFTSSSDESLVGAVLSIIDILVD